MYLECQNHNFYVLFYIIAKSTFIYFSSGFILANVLITAIPKYRKLRIPYACMENNHADTFTHAFCAIF